ncbi:hypothetical protein COV25_04335 [candidate division WWE3 bacterium CG10_big_fil_rev_8_21_14_0_10_35_32]|nr:MAG: hypothetical protein COV25_04335 [candidate division WWE3 bacterium CG10_big_fil_rev_8_21_14_0_10_35_32]
MINLKLPAMYVGSISNHHKLIFGNSREFLASSKTLGYPPSTFVVGLGAHGKAGGLILLHYYWLYW